MFFDFLGGGVVVGVVEVAQQSLMAMSRTGLNWVKLAAIGVSCRLPTSPCFSGILIVTCTVVTYYHYLITIHEEVRFVWLQRFSGATIIYLANRYVVLFSTILISIVTFTHTDSESAKVRESACYIYPIVILKVANDNCDSCKSSGFD